MALGNGPRIDERRERWIIIVELFLQHNIYGVNLDRVVCLEAPHSSAVQDIYRLDIPTFVSNEFSIVKLPPPCRLVREYTLITSTDLS
ncbi:hypothetical protein BDV40DRAFT_276583 [Aspergillus tamarii]|uniref:Uncharacterized protein n=1 Tax=Aspergillus tamarii TaxID=41984 RepID=A0A5N6UHN2_ASPTM|nr:hypothetical protein BDV40DRAFT_276583 [Aspergillus tamarii]